MNTKLLFSILFSLLLSSCSLVVHQGERCIVTTDGASLYVNVKGEGPLCLYVHGGPGSGALWMERFFGDFLEKHFTMVYLDQRGVGRSSSPAAGDYSMSRMVRDFEEVREALGVKKWLTLGHSFGGILQMGYVEACPVSHMGMMMVNCTLSMEDSFREGWFPRAAQLLGDQAQAVLQDEGRSLLERAGYAGASLSEKGIFWQMHYSTPESKSAVDATFGEVTDWNNDFGNIALSLDDYWRDYTADTPAVDLPVLFFYGKNDWAIGAEHYKKVAFPNMVLWASDVDHMPFLEGRVDLENAILFYLNKYKF